MMYDFGFMISQLPGIFVKYYAVPFNIETSHITYHKSPIKIPLEFSLRLALL
jgi:hypothetical protein